MRTFFISLALLFVTTVATAQDRQVGDAVMANFRKEGRWFPAVIVEVHEGKMVRVVYQDGFKEKRGPKTLRPDTLGAGSKVDAPREGGYTTATVEKRFDDVALIVFEDGTKACRGVGQLGVKTENLEEVAAVRDAEAAQPVMATWKDDADWYYCGQVVETSEKGSRVVFQDGTFDWRTAAQIKAGRPRPGDTVQVKLPGEPAFVDATLRTIIGSYAVRVTMPDKTMVWTALSRIRVAAK